jgi:polar amino acid transport system ATP-binding protein
VVAVIGPSGSGKSTFLRCLNHLETINRGRIEIEGETLVGTDETEAHLCRYVADLTGASAARWAWSFSTSTSFRI